AGQIRFGETCAALVEGDHVSDLAHGHEQWKARPPRGANTTAARTAREIDNGWSRVFGSALEPDKSQFDQVAFGIAPVFRNQQSSKLGIDFAVFAILKN